MFYITVTSDPHLNPALQAVWGRRKAIRATETHSAVGGKRESWGPGEMWGTELLACSCTNVLTFLAVGSAHVPQFPVEAEWMECVFTAGLAARHLPPVLLLSDC